MPIDSNNMVSVEGAELGRYLFYDSILSRDYSMHCGSCHKQEFAFSDGGKKFSIGINGKPLKRNTPPLFNLAWYERMFWDGKAKSIEEQVFFPVRDHDEMDVSWDIVVSRLQKSDFYRKKFLEVFGEVPIDSVLVSKAIGQFERTLISNKSKFDRVLKGEGYLDSNEYQGFVLINDHSMADCLNCHSTDADAMGTNGGFANNGLDFYSSVEGYVDKGYGQISNKKEDIGNFKIPSLRNLSFTGPYMHDGRFSTLDEVVRFYSDSVKKTVNLDYLMTHYSNGRRHLTMKEQKQILAYLLTLNDTSFVSNPEFSNPFNTPH